MLNQLASIAKNLFLLNSNSILNELIEEKHFKNIVGMLEFDAAFVEPKKHREFLWERSKFREVLPISSEELRTKIHQTFRLQYVQDVCLPAPSIFEENLLTVLNSHLFFIRAEIVNSLLNDKELLQQLFEELRNPLIEPERQRDLTNFLKEFCSFAHSLQPNGPQGKDQFFRTLIDNNVLGTIDPCISSSLPTTRTATVELLTIVVDFNPQLFRDFLMKQSRQEGRNDFLLINKLIKHMLSDRDAEFTAGGQMSQVLRVLLDPEGVLAIVFGARRFAQRGFSSTPEADQRARHVDNLLAEDILLRRNERMARRADLLLRSHPSAVLFFALGAGHLLGDQSIQTHLRQLGYWLAPVGEQHKIAASCRRPVGQCGGGGSALRGRRRPIFWTCPAGTENPCGDGTRKCCRSSRGDELRCKFANCRRRRATTKRGDNGNGQAAAFVGPLVSKNS
uniref:SMK-1 domain-containing protein n=1 Tax=Globodera pallida TaxID=36090 RepID=A0A183CPF8_GLOPA